MPTVKKVNEKLWEVEDKLRILEEENDFSLNFVNFARSVYHINDEELKSRGKLMTYLAQR